MATDRGSNTLVQRIALDGGDDIKKELESLGKAGEIAFKQLAKAAKNAKIDTEFTKSLGLLKVRFRDLQAAGARIGRDFTSLGKSVDTVGKSFDTVVTRIGLFTAAVAGAGAAIFAFAKSGADAAVQITNQAKALGLTTDAYQNLQAVALETELDQGDFEKLISKFTLALGEHGKAANKAAKSQKDLNAAARVFGDDIFDSGVKVGSLAEGFTDADLAAQRAGKTILGSGKGFDNLGLKAKTTEGRLIEFAQRIDAIKDPVQQFQAVAEIFGEKLALRFQPVLIQIADNVREFGNVARSAVEPLNKLELAAGLRLDAALDGLNTTILRTRLHLAELFAAPVARGADQLNRFIGDHQKQLRAFVQQIVDRAVPAVEDLFNLVTGNDAAVKNPAFLEWRDQIVQFGRDLKTIFETVVVPTFKGVKAAADLVADALNGIFGGSRTGGEVLLVAGILQAAGAFKLLVSALGLVLRAGLTVKDILFAIPKLVRVVGATFVVLTEGAEAFGAVLVGLLGWPALLAVAFAAATAAIILNWDTIKKKAQESADFLKAKIAEIRAPNAIGGPDERANPLNTSGLPLTDPTSLIKQGEEAKQFWTEFWNDIKQQAAEAKDSILASWSDFSSQIGTILQGIGDSASGAWDGFVQSTEAKLGELITFVQSIPDQIVAAFGAVSDALGNVWDGAIESLKSAIGSLVSFAEDIAGQVKRAVQSALDAIDAVKRAGSEIASGLGLAAGGPVIGPGGPTEDKVLMWGSNGEFMQRAAAVRKYGLAFMHAVNRGMLSVDAVRDLMRGRFARFAAGGPIMLQRLVEVPRFAAGGLVQAAQQAALVPAIAGQPLHLHLPGGDVVQVIAPSDAVQQLNRHAMRGQLRSGGPKPPWYGK